MTAWLQTDYDRAGDRDADRVTASPPDLRAEFEHGKATAWQMTERSAEGGRSADYIEQRHLELERPDRGPGAAHPRGERVAPRL